MPKLRAIVARTGGRSGQGLVEYSLIIALVILAAIGGLTLFGGGIRGLFSRIGGSF